MYVCMRVYMFINKQSEQHEHRASVKPTEPKCKIDTVWFESDIHICEGTRIDMRGQMMRPEHV